LEKKRNCGGSFFLKGESRENWGGMAAILRADDEGPGATRACGSETSTAVKKVARKKENKAQTGVAGEKHVDFLAVGAG